MKKHIAIIGGGFTGLGAAHELAKRADVSLTVFESSSDIGGLAGAFPVGGTFLEQYYHHLFPGFRGLRALANEIGIGEKVFFKKARSGNFTGGKIYPFTSPFDLLRFSPLAFHDRLRLGCGIAYLKSVKRWQRFEHATAAAWLRKFFGEKVYRLMWHPLLAGKFGEQAETVGMAWFWSRIFERPSSFGYIRGGFKTLTDAWKGYLEARGVSFRISTPVRRIIADAQGGVVVRTDSGEDRYDAALVAAPPGVFLRIAPDLSAEYRQQLERLPYCGTISLVLTLDRSFSPYYWLNIQDETLPILAVVEHTNFVGTDAYGGRHLLYVAKYLDPSSALYNLSPEDILARYIEALKKIRPDFDRSWIVDWKLFRAPATQPIVPADYARPKIATQMRNVFFASMSHVYPWDRGTEHSFQLGREAAGIIADAVLQGSSASAK